jgi:O-antigen/teichoic acid export membrane protein
MNRAPENSIKRYGINAASSVVTRVLQLTVLVWVNQFLLRRIAPEEYSLYPLVLSLMVFAELFRTMFTSGLGRYIVEADSRDDAAGVTRVVSSMFPVLVLLGLCFALLGGLAAWKLDRLLNIEPQYLFEARLMLLLLVATLCVNVMAAPFSEGLYARQRFVTLNLVALACEGLRIGLLLVLLFGVGTKVLWLVVATTASALTSVSLLVIMTWRLIPAVRFRWECFSLQTVRTLFGFGLWTTVGAIGGLVSSTVPALLLNRFGTALDVASFHLGRLPDTQLRNVVAAAGAPAQPALTRIYAREGAAALKALYYRGGRYYLWLALVLLAPLLAFNDVIMTLYAGERYVESARVMAVLLGVYPCLWASAMFFQVVYAMGRVREFYVCDLIIQGVTLVALFYLVVMCRMGAFGAALALGLTSGVLHMLIIWPKGLASVGGQWSTFVRLTLLPGLLPFGMALTAAYGFRFLFEINSWLMVAGATLLVVAVYGMALLFFCLDGMDRRLLAKVIGQARTLLERANGVVPSTHV